jgi:hypothetical protein
MFNYKTVKLPKAHSKYPCDHAERVDCLSKALASWDWEQCQPDRYGRIVFRFKDTEVYLGKRNLVLQSISSKHRVKKIEWCNLRGTREMRSLLERIEAFAYRLD